MLLAFFKYATKLLKYNMTTILLRTATTTASLAATAAAIATATITTATTTTNNLTNLTSTSHFQSLAYTLHATTNSTFTSADHARLLNATTMLPERSAATLPAALETFKTLFNKTVDNVVAQVNLNDYSTTASFPSPSSSSPAPAYVSSAGANFINSSGSFMLPMANATTNVVGGSVSLNSTTATATTTTTAATSISSLSTTTSSAASRYAILETTTRSTFPAAQTVATFMTAGNKNRPTIIIYPTVAPESIVIPIVSCIFGFPILAFLVICCLRRRAKLARERDRRRNYDMQDHAVSLVRFSPIHRLNYRPTRAISLRPERSLSQGFTSLELDTVVEERCSDVEQTQTEILNAESPMETTSSYKMSFSS